MGKEFDPQTYKLSIINLSLSGQKRATVESLLHTQISSSIQHYFNKKSSSMEKNLVRFDIKKLAKMLIRFRLPTFF